MNSFIPDKDVVLTIFHGAVLEHVRYFSFAHVACNNYSPRMLAIKVASCFALDGLGGAFLIVCSWLLFLAYRKINNGNAWGLEK